MKIKLEVISSNPLKPLLVQVHIVSFVKIIERASEASVVLRVYRNNPAFVSTYMYMYSKYYLHYKVVFG